MKSKNRVKHIRWYFIIIFLVPNIVCYCQDSTISKDRETYIEKIQRYKDSIDSLVLDFHKNPASQIQWSVTDGNCSSTSKYFDQVNKCFYIQHTSICKDDVEVKFYLLNDSIVFADLYIYEKKATYHIEEIYMSNMMVSRIDHKGKKLKRKIVDFDVLNKGYALLKDD